VWRDAYSYDTGWVNPADLRCRPVIVTSVGFVINENEHGIVLALDSADDGDFNTCGFIPQSCVVSRMVLLDSEPAAPADCECLG